MRKDEITQLTQRHAQAMSKQKTKLVKQLKCQKWKFDGQLREQKARRIEDLSTQEEQYKNGLKMQTSEHLNEMCKKEEEHDKQRERQKDDHAEELRKQEDTHKLAILELKNKLAVANKVNLVSSSCLIIYHMCKFLTDPDASRRTQT